MPLADGTAFAGYTILRLLGAGGMGEVYLAQHPRLPRRDALKLLPLDWSADPDYRARFIREADLASTLWHPHIVGVHDRGEADGQLWISMDFVDGLDAARFLADRYPAGMPVEEVVRIVTAVAGGLDYAHKQGMLHRDVKPANIMLAHLDDDGERRILLTDFGIARPMDDSHGLTATNTTVGTVAYSAPEQLMGEPISGRADQYALGAAAYHLLTGSVLFQHSNQAVAISHHLNAEPPLLSKKRPELKALDHVLARALAKSPSDRYPRCADFARSLAAGQAGSPRKSVSSACEPPEPTPPGIAPVESTELVSQSRQRTRVAPPRKTPPRATSTPPKPFAPKKSPAVKPREVDKKAKPTAAAKAEATGEKADISEELGQSLYKLFKVVAIPGAVVLAVIVVWIVVFTITKATSDRQSHSPSPLASLSTNIAATSSMNPTSTSAVEQQTSTTGVPPPPPESAIPPRASTPSTLPTTTQIVAGQATGDACSDYDKLSVDAYTGEQIYCDPYLNQLGNIVGVHATGTSCAGSAAYVDSRSTDGYLIWCSPGASIAGPDGVAPSGSTWEKYAP